MSISILPRVVTVLDASGHPWFGATWNGTNGDETNVIWLAEPVLIPGHHWADPAAVTGGLALDVATVAELLYHRLDVDPDALDDAQAAQVIAAELDAVNCDMDRCCADVAADLADHYDGGQRYSRCVLAAGRLLGTEV